HEQLVVALIRLRNPLDHDVYGLAGGDLRRCPPAAAGSLGGVVVAGAADGYAQVREVPNHQGGIEHPVVRHLDGVNDLGAMIGGSAGKLELRRMPTVVAMRQSSIDDGGRLVATGGAGGFTIVIVAVLVSVTVVVASVEAALGTDAV